MSNKLTKREAERLIAALDDLCDDDRLQRLRDAAASALAILLGRDAPWNDLVEAAATSAGWSADRVRLLRADYENSDDAIEALYELITEVERNPQPLKSHPEVGRNEPHQIDGLCEAADMT